LSFSDTRLSIWQDEITEMIPLLARFGHSHQAITEFDMTQWFAVEDVPPDGDCCPTAIVKSTWPLYSPVNHNLPPDLLGVKYLIGLFHIDMLARIDMS